MRNGGWDSIHRASPAAGTAIVLSINPIDTSTLRVPPRFADRPFDDPVLIRDFNKFVDFVLAGVPNATIAAVSIGNEIDGWLADDPKKWSQYARFFAAVREHIKETRPDVPIGVKTTWTAAVRSHKVRVQAINANADWK